MPLLAGQRVVVLDFETTGWEPERAAIVEIGRVTLDGGAITDEWSSLVRPGRPMPPDAARVHGITDAMVADALRPWSARARGARRVRGRHDRAAQRLVRSAVPDRPDAAPRRRRS